MRNRAVQGVLSGAAAATLLLYLATALPRAAGVTRFLLLLPQHTDGESPAQARARLFGAAYAAGIDALRAAMPENRPYFLVSADALRDGSAFWVRYDLAPRPPLYLGSLHGLRDAAGFRRALGNLGSLKVVIAVPGGPPWILDGEGLARWLDGHAAVEKIPGTPTADPGAAPAPPPPSSHAH